MKKISLAVVVLFLGIFSLQAQEWQTNLETAKNLASEANQPIILVFQGSDWCAPCIKLDREVFNTPTFQEYAKDHFIMLKADFPRKKKNKLKPEQKKQNRALAAKYNQQGVFPLVVVMDEDGKVLGKTGYKKTTPADYINLLSSFEK